MKYFIFFYILLYIYLILKNLFMVKRIDKLTQIILNYLQSASVYQDPFFVLKKKDNYYQCLNELLYNYPAIARYKNTHKTLEYGVSSEENYKNATIIYNDLLMQRNYAIYDFFQSLSPVKALKVMFSIPSLFIDWLGFRPSDIFSKIFNLICWSFAYFLNMYSFEIKSLINAFIQG